MTNYKEVDTEEAVNNSIGNHRISDSRDRDLTEIDTANLTSSLEKKRNNIITSYIINMYILLCLIFVFGFLPAFDFIVSSFFLVQPDKQMFYTFVNFTIIALGLLKALDKGFLSRDEETINQFNIFFFSRKGSYIDFLAVSISVGLYLILLSVNFFEINSIISKTLFN